MATFVTIKLPKEQSNLYDALFEKVAFLESKFSTYQEDAELFLLNHHGSSKTISKELKDILLLSQKIYQETYGYFNISIGTLTKDLYKFGTKDAQIPSKKAIKRSKIVKKPFELTSKSIKLRDGVKLDLGGMAKGYTVDKLRMMLEEKNVQDFTISLSGDIYCKGSCEIAIQSPFEKDKFLTTLKVKDSAVSTSGNYERYIKNKKYNHLINPKTKQSQQEIASITLVSKTVSNVRLDAYTTALAVMPKKSREKFLLEHPSIDYVIVFNDKKQVSRLNI